MNFKIKKFKHSLSIFVATVLISFLGVSGCARKDSSNKKSITVKGSDTMVQLMSSWAESFKKVNPAIEVSVTGGGSGTGIAALINGTTDICASSREMQEKEKQQASQKNITPKEVVVARDGLAVFVNPENPVKELTMEQIRKIYTGAYKNWREVGGPDQSITTLSRENSSGTYVFFQEHVLNKQDYAKEVRLMTSTSAIVQSISDEKWSIGYGGIAYALAGKVKILNVKKDDTSSAVTPSDETVLNGTYPIARPLYLYFKGDPKDNLKTFLDYCLSADGQKVVKEVGYITVK
ncbi:MAG: phosphate ABC transporter substrate-binding protein [Ignavibacteria bacterium]